MTEHARPLWADLPHGEVISVLIDELHTLTDSEARDMATAWSATPEDEWHAAWFAARGAELVASRDAAGNAAAWATVRDAEWDAVLALVVADLAGQRGLTREHLGVLTGPARAVPRLAEIINRALPIATKET